MIKGQTYNFNSNEYYKQFENIETMLFFFPLVKENNSFYCAKKQYNRINVYSETKKYSDYKFVFINQDSILLTSNHLLTPFKHTTLDTFGERQVTDFLILFCIDTKEFIGLDADFEKYMIEI